MIIAITGMPLAGKASVRKIFEYMGCPSFIMRKAVEDEMERVGLKVTRESLREFATKIREERGRGIAGELSIPYLRKLLLKDDLIIVDGVRSPEELDVFKREFGNDFVLLCVWAPFRLRVQRLGTREVRKDEIYTEEELKERDRKELSWGLGETIALADYLITNMDTKENLEAKLYRFLRSVVAIGMKKMVEWKTTTPELKTQGVAGKVISS